MRSIAPGEDRLENFIRQEALPLWAEAGYDKHRRCFHEFLSFSAKPPDGVPRRLMVQARQIVVYARAHLLGWHKDGATLAMDAFETLTRLYKAPEDEAGWIFSVQEDGSCADATRDLYAHAFVLYMLAWIYRISPDPRVIALADRTLSDIDAIFHPAHGDGYLSKVPGSESIREQNPHMHLFEALLALAEVTHAERYLARSADMLRLFEGKLVDPASGTVREVFDAGWNAARTSGQNEIEPGHQMEWAWLLREWARLSGKAVDEHVRRLVEHTARHGIDASSGLVRSVVKENGDAIAKPFRIWPQTETIRALCRENTQLRWSNLIASVTDNLFRVHLPAHLQGGWIDQVHGDGSPAVAFMPASTLYHIAGCAMDVSHLKQANAFN